MKYQAEINVMPLKELLDPQGKAVVSGLKNLNLSAITDVRVGKHLSIIVEADNETDAREQIDTACNKLLANPVIEYYEYSLQALN